mgnify:CR=1 FL=1
MNEHKRMERTSTKIQMIADFEGDANELLENKPEGIYPMLCTRDLVVFPTVLTPIIVGRDISRNLANLLANKPDTLFCIFCQKNRGVELPGFDDLYHVGVFAKLVRILNMPDGSGNQTIIVQAMGRCELKNVTALTPYYQAEVESLPEIWGSQEDTNFRALHETFVKESLSYVNANENVSSELGAAITEISHPMVQSNFMCCAMPFSVEDKIEMLSKSDLNDRLVIALRSLHKEMKLLRLQNEISQKTHYDLDEQQKEYFLKQQIKNIRQELGDEEGSPERKEIMEKAKTKQWNEATQKVFKKEMAKLDTIHPQSPDYPIQVGYLQTLVDLPWNECTKDDLSIPRAKRILNQDHYGMEKVKERILEYLAVRALKGGQKSPILCLYGPPGVGKTSLGKSIAAAMKRKYVRMSLGGLHDESEIRGHRRTYIGAMPGRIIKNIQKAGSSNPVFILDEIDKVAQDNFHGDPSSALLEVLDPEQNNAFHDNYLDVDYDLSKVLFIATANELSNIPRPLLDRMELIEVGGYITEEKIEIAKRHLVPKEIENTGLEEQDPKISFNKAALENIIEHYTRETGVRQLKKQINKCLRKVAYEFASTGKIEHPTIGAAEIKGLLGTPPFNRDIYQGNDYAGVVTGLAWTSVGGEILYIETSLSKGKAAKLTLTGNLGNVMKESAVIALEYVKAHVDLLGVDYRIFDNWNIHIHVPEGATPKDGPSAGITIATSIASAITQRKVRKNIAMTGEITLRGKVLPVGGIKEKILAAKRAGITDIVMCKDNRKNIEEIPEKYLKGVEFHYVENVADVWQIALTDEKVEHPIDLTIKEEKEEKKED